MKKAFFEPFVGARYQKGINGKKVLVLGASFYCPHTECPFFAKCTDTVRKDSSAYDETCPVYKEQGICLHDEPANSIGNGERAYSSFAEAMAGFAGTDDYNEVWSHLAFTNYVQFFLPANGEGFRPTYASDLSERDFDAFIEVVRTLRPDVVIIWGCVINSRLKEQNAYVTDKDSLPANDWYLCHMRVPGTGHDITLVNPNHPSSTAWHSDMDTFLHYLGKALG